MVRVVMSGVTADDVLSADERTMVDRAPMMTRGCFAGSSHFKSAFICPESTLTQPAVGSECEAPGKYLVTCKKIPPPSVVFTPAEARGRALADMDITGWL